MLIFVYVILFSILMFIGYRLNQLWAWFNIINQEIWISQNTQKSERVFRFIRSLPKQFYSLNSTKLIMSGKLFKMYTDLARPEMIEYLDKVTMQMDKYVSVVLDKTIEENFYQWSKLTGTSYGHFHLCLLRYLYFFQYCELRHTVDITTLAVDLKARAPEELKTYLEEAGPLTPKVLVDNECRIFFNQLLTKYDEDQHGERDIVESIIVGQLLNLDKMTSLLGESVRENYNKEVLGI